MRDHRLINYSNDCQAEASQAKRMQNIPSDFQDPGFDKLSLLPMKFK